MFSGAYLTLQEGDNRLLLSSSAGAAFLALKKLYTQAHITVLYGTYMTTQPAPTHCAFTIVDKTPPQGTAQFP